MKTKNPFELAAIVLLAFAVTFSALTATKLIRRLRKPKADPTTTFVVHKNLVATNELVEVINVGTNVYEFWSATNYPRLPDGLALQTDGTKWRVVNTNFIGGGLDWEIVRGDSAQEALKSYWQLADFVARRSTQRWTNVEVK